MPATRRRGHGEHRHPHPACLDRPRQHSKAIDTVMDIDVHDHHARHRTCRQAEICIRPPTPPPLHLARVGAGVMEPARCQRTLLPRNARKHRHLRGREFTRHPPRRPARARRQQLSQLVQIGRHRLTA